MTTTSPTTAPRWMSDVLVAAGIYNLVWGAVTILFPHLLFDWVGIDRPNYPGLWQCIGMIVGVYGIGYIAAAYDPYRHWPIVLVGFLGKIFGPIGFLTSTFPWTFGLTIITNDLIWWYPFSLILLGALSASMDPARRGTVRVLTQDEALSEARDADGVSIAEHSRQSPVLLTFLRHSGCTFCREALADLKQRRAEIEAKGVRLAVVAMSQPADLQAFLSQYDLADVIAVSDPECTLYRSMGLKRGTWGQLFGRAVFKRGNEAFFAGHGVGKLDGDGFQMPGVFLISNGRVVTTFRHEHAGQRPDYVSLADCPVPVTSSPPTATV